MTGANVRLTELTSVEALGLLAVATVLALLTKLAGGWLGALKLGPRAALTVGVGMMPRGEVGVVIASLGLAAHVFSERMYAVIIAMSLLTSVIAPPVLAALLRRSGEVPRLASQDSETG
jgi:Kef-type K+ transport system membrane component KefB